MMRQNDSRQSFKITPTRNLIIPESTPEVFFFKGSVILEHQKQVPNDFPFPTWFHRVMSAIHCSRMPISADQDYAFDTRKQRVLSRVKGSISGLDTKRKLNGDETEYEDDNLNLQRTPTSFYPYLGDFQDEGGLMVEGLMSSKCSGDRFSVVAQHLLFNDDGFSVPTFQKVSLKGLRLSSEHKTGYDIEVEVELDGHVTSSKVFRSDDSLKQLQAILLLHFPCVSLCLVDERFGGNEGRLSTMMFLSDLFIESEIFNSTQCLAFFGLQKNHPNWSELVHEMDQKVEANFFNGFELQRATTFNQSIDTNSNYNPGIDIAFRQIFEEIQAMDVRNRRLWSCLRALATTRETSDHTKDGQPQGNGTGELEPTDSTRIHEKFSTLFSWCEQSLRILNRESQLWTYTQTHVPKETCHNRNQTQFLLQLKEDIIRKLNIIRMLYLDTGRDLVHQLHNENKRMSKIIERFENEVRQHQ